MSTGLLRRIGALGVVVYSLIVTVGGVPLPDFVPFGPNVGDDTLPSSNDASADATLTHPIPFYGQDRSYVTIHTDGQLSLRVCNTSVDSARIYVFSADVDTTSLGQVFYRETSDTAILDNVAGMLQELFPELADYTPTSVFVVTWFYVGYFDNHDDLANTFQCFLVTNGSLTLTGFLYADELMEWTTGDADGGVNGMGGDAADVGFIGDGDSNQFFILPSGSSDIITVDTLTNVGIPGLWIFRVNEGNISVTGVEVMGDSDLSGSGIGSGAPSEGSCIATGFTDCCISAINCTTGSGSGECYCDQICYFNKECCSDIRDTCPPPVVVEFSDVEYTVIENAGSALVSVNVTGFHPDIAAEAHVLLYTGDVTAEAPSDYEGTIIILHFDSDGEQSVSIPINNDSVVEATEHFSVHITTTEDLVQLGADSANVTILDASDSLQITGANAPLTVGDTANITCSSDLFVSSIEWLYNGQVVLSSMGQQELELLFNPVNDSIHNRQYTCRATSPFGVQEDTVTLTANVPPTSALRISTSSEGVAVIGQPYTLTCTASKLDGLSDTPDVVWLDSDENQIVSGGEITVSPTATSGNATTVSLEFSALLTSHAGQYTCQASLDSPALTVPITANSTETITVETSNSLFQLRLTGLFECSEWRIENTDEKVTAIADSVVRILSEYCFCSIEVGFISEMSLSCPDEQEDVVFRARIYSTPEANNSVLISNLEKWVMTEPSVVIQNVTLLVDPNCLVEIESFDVPLCSRQTPIVEEASPANLFSTAMIIGIVVAVVLLLVTVTLCGTVTCYWRHRRRRSLPLRGADVVACADDHELVKVHEVLVCENPAYHPPDIALGPGLARSPLYGPPQDFEIHHNVNVTADI